MANKNNGDFPLRSTRSKPEFLRNDSIESIISSGNTNPGCTAQRIFVSAMDTINHILIVLVTIYIVYYAAKEYSVTNVHVILCTIGYVLLMSEAIVVLASNNVLTASLSRRANKHLHWILQAIGLILNLVGVGVMYNVKTVHLLSIHGIAGFVIGMVSQCYGYKKSWVYHVTKMKHVDETLLVITVLITILSLRGALSSLFRQAADCLKLLRSST